MRISMMAAMGRNRVIGRDSKLPWHLPNDMQFFRQVTKGKPVVMGRKTLESMDGKPLPKRLNIVLTRDLHLSAPGCIVVHSVREAIHVAGDVPELMIVGGGEIYTLFMPYADRLYLTVVDGNFEGDAFFPDFTATDWTETAKEPHPADERHSHAYTFYTLDRIQPSANLF